MMCRRKVDERVASVPNQWSGSVQQNYHFLLGYLAPITLWLDRHPALEITVRDCGPINRWFKLLAPETDFDSINMGNIRHVFVSKLQPCQVLRG